MTETTIWRRPYLAKARKVSGNPAGWSCAFTAWRWAVPISRTRPADDHERHQRRRAIRTGPSHRAVLQHGPPPLDHRPSAILARWSSKEGRISLSRRPQNRQQAKEREAVYAAMRASVALEAFAWACDGQLKDRSGSHAMGMISGARKLPSLAALATTMPISIPAAYPRHAQVTVTAPACDRAGAPR